MAAVTLAANEINSKGGINGRRVEIIAEDDQCSSKGVAALQKLINVDNVDAVLGPLCSAAAGPALPLAQNSDVPTIIIGSAPHLTAIGDYIFRVYPSDAFQGKVAAEFMYKTLGKKKVAIIYVQNDWGQGIKEVFEKRFKELGGQVTYVAAKGQDSKDYKTEITKVKDSGAEAVYTPLYPGGGLAALKQIKELDLGINVVGGDAFSGDEIPKSGYGEGVIYTQAKTNMPDDFRNKLREIPGYSGLELNIGGPYYYDAAMTMFDAIQRAGSTDPIAIKNALRQTSRKGLATDLIEFDQQGDLKAAEFEFKVIKNGEVVSY
ncbi:ABC transporter substrate-binding protein [Candidatus Woesearchaeota archaeon]|nr:ABC transporter substrate-binding protein [Candidatus Woesearchaeota archaeon]